jgi:hypothetical protein
MAIVKKPGVGAWMTLGPVVAEDTFGPAGWGFALTAMAVGMLLGTLLLLRFSWQHPLRIGIGGALLVAVPITALTFPTYFPAPRRLVWAA